MLVIFFLFWIQTIGMFILLTSTRWSGDTQAAQPLTQPLSANGFQQPRQLLSITSSIGNTSRSLFESNGWIKQTDEDWELYKKIFWEARKQQNTRPDLFWRDIKFYQNFVWFPEASCPTAVLRIGKGDGGKMVCDPYRLAKPDCLVYSIGSNGDFSFEASVREYNPNCEIHTFDHTWDGNPPEWLTYHHTGIGLVNGGQFKNIATIVQELGHVNRRIDMLKIDCEGCEFDVYPNFYMPGVNIAQLLIEVHYKLTRPSHKKVEAMFWNMMDNGFVMFQKEPNIPWGCGESGEFSFLRFNPDYFHLKLPDGSYPHNYPEIEEEFRHEKNGMETAS